MVDIPKWRTEAEVRDSFGIAFKTIESINQDNDYAGADNAAVLEHDELFLAYVAASSIASAATAVLSNMTGAPVSLIIGELHMATSEAIATGPSDAADGDGDGADG